MSVYVDNMLMPADVRNGSTVHRSRWSHLTADTVEELHEFAVGRLGLKRSWFQDGRHPHYDLTEGMRYKALRLGAQPVEYGQSPDIARRAAEAARVQAAGETGEPPVNITGPGEVPLLLLTGPREGATWADVEGALRPRFCKDTVLLAGGARGTDKMGAWLWRSWGGQVEEDPVSPEEWDRNPKAGYDRNDRMIARVVKEGGKVVAVIAPCEKPQCRRRPKPHITHGTAHCVTGAERAGLAVDRVPVARADLEPEPPGHHWKDTAVPDQKQCGGCGTTATRARRPGQAGWTVTFRAPGSARPSQAPPPCREQEPAPPQPPEPWDDPGTHPGDPGPGQPGRTAWLGRFRGEPAVCGCGDTFLRVAGSTEGTCLRCEMSQRQAAAGITANDPGLRKAVTWNAALGAIYPERDQEPGLAEPELQRDAEATA